MTGGADEIGAPEHLTPQHDLAASTRASPRSTTGSGDEAHRKPFVYAVVITPPTE